MKLLEVFRMIDESQFLMERDVINAKELKQWAKESATRLTDPQAATWYASQLSKYLINRYEAGLRTAQFDAQAPDWVMAKLDAGERIFEVEPQQELRQQAEQVIDWLNAQTAENSNVNLRMTWEDAVEAQDEWHKDMARQSRVTELTAEQMEGIVTIMEFDDGFRWVDVQTEVCLKHEGTVMGHCVGGGGYTQGVQEGTTKILSLRDGNNNPHATIEGDSEHPIMINKDMLNSAQADLFLDNALEKSFIHLAIRQIKGKENKPVVRKYRDYVQEFLTKFGIEDFEYGGYNDLENCGLFQLKKGGFINDNEIGEQIAKMEDGTIWHRVDDEYVHLHTYSGNIAAKWFLFDKTGRSLGTMAEQPRSMISRISFEDDSPIKYQNHVATAFASKYDKSRASIYPDKGLYQAFYNTLEQLGLGVNGKAQVGEPQTVGDLFVKTEVGDVYATASVALDSNMYWLMHGDQIKARFDLSIMSIDEDDGYTMRFDKNRGVPSGSIVDFVKKVEGAFDTGLKIRSVEVQNQTIALNDITWEPNQNINHEDNFLMEEDGVTFYESLTGNSGTWYNAIDKHNQLLFNMSLAKGKFKVRWVNNKKVAGYYAVYLLEHLETEEDIDIGDKGNYSSFAREFLEETDWFQSDFNHKGMNRQNYWMVMDETFPIHFTETHSYDDGTEEDVYDDETTMRHYWTETGLYDSGMEVDYFAGEYDQVYAGNNIGYDDEHDYYDNDYEGPAHTRTDYYVQGIGDENTVMHPISGGSMRIQK